jgi:hypothetical protein
MGGEGLSNVLPSPWGYSGNDPQACAFLFSRARLLPILLNRSHVPIPGCDKNMPGVIMVS